MKVTWTCFMHPFTAMGVIAINVVKELSNLGIDVGLNVLNPEEINLSDYPKEVQNAISVGFRQVSTNIFFSYPDIFPRIRAKVNVGYTGADSTGWYNTPNQPSPSETCNTFMDYMLTPSDYSRQIMKNCGVNIPIDIYPHGIDSKLFLPVQRTKPITGEPFRFLYCGELSRRKGSQDLIKAFIEVFGNMDNFELVLRANTHMKFYDGEEIEKLCSSVKNIKLNWKDQGQSDLQTYYMTSHVYVYPSRADWFGMTPFEALATGLPVIASNTNGYDEFLKDKIIRVPTREEEIGDQHPYLRGNWHVVDFNSLKYMMKAAYENYDLVSSMANNNSKQLYKDFSWSQVTKDYLIPFLEKVERETIPQVSVSHQVRSEIIEVLNEEGDGEVKKEGVEIEIKPVRVTVGIPTKDRGIELSLLLQSLLFQTFQNFDVIIVNDCHTNLLQENSTLQGLFKVLRDSGHELTIIDGDKKGPQWGGQRILEASKNEYILRLDDDVSLRPTFIEELVKVITSNDKIGAVGPVYLNPQEAIKNQILDISKEEKEYYGTIFWDKNNNLFLTGILQNKFHKDNTPIKVQHLNSGFMYRKSAGKKLGNYCLELSKVGHREESDWSYRIFREGYELYVVPSAIAFHFHPFVGGIRETLGDFHRKELWDHDEKIFLTKMKQWLPLNEDDRFVSIIMLTNNDHSLLKRSLISIYKYTNHPCEIIVVNNDISEESKRIFKEDPDFINDNLKLIQLDREVSVSEARNIGVGHSNSKSKYVCFFDDDALILGRYNQSTDWLDYLYNLFNEEKETGAVGPIYTWYEPLKTYTLSVACMFTSRKIWDKVGGFDSVFGNKFKGTWGYEDVDWSYRCVSAGFKLKGITIPDFPFYHEDTTNKEKPKWRLEGLQKAEQLLFEKHNKNQIDKFCRTKYPFYPSQMSVRGKKLNIGCYHMKLDGFINVDIQDGIGADVVCDMREIDKYFQPNSISLIVISQCLEHVSKEDGTKVLAKLKNLLVPGGHLIVEVPDVTDADEKLKKGELSKYDHHVLFHGSTDPHQQHLSAFTDVELLSTLNMIGFNNIKKSPLEMCSDQWKALRYDCIK